MCIYTTSGFLRCVLTERVSYNRLANVLRVPLSTIKGMAYKKKAFAKISPDELRERISTIARVVEVRATRCGVMLAR